MVPWYISVDVETAGPFPRRHSLLAIGACAVLYPDRAFYAELRPESPEADPGALAVAGLSMDDLAETGEEPSHGWARFADWVEEVTPSGRLPVMVAFNAPFDWMFIADGLHRYAGRNPFGHSAVDIKALAMGAAGIGWAETSFAALAARYGLPDALPHHALQDAMLQAELFSRILSSTRREEGDEQHG